MLPDPLHPALVHFPIVLAIFLPIVAAGVALAIRTGRLGRTAWWGVVALAFLTTVSVIVVRSTGEDQEDRVERIVSERALETHEENAETLFYISLITLVFAGTGLIKGSLGTTARVATFLVSLAAVGSVVLTGRSGGELVYRHGAAAAYVATDSAPLPSAHRDDD